MKFNNLNQCENRSQLSGKLVRLFVQSAGIVLLCTGLAKGLSAFGHARALDLTDPILGLTYRNLFLYVSVLELIAAAFCLFTRRPVVQARLITWLAAMFFAYRFGNFLIGYQKPCSCLGNMVGVLHIAPETADSIMKALLAYLIAGGVLSLLWCRREPASITATPIQPQN